MPLAARPRRRNRRQTHTKEQAKGEKMRIAAKLTYLGLMVALGGCSALSAINPFASKAAPRNPPAELVQFTPSLTVRTAWTAPAGNAGAYAFSPVFAKGSIFAAAADGSVTRIDASTGQPAWRVSAGMPLTAGVGSDGDTVAVAGEKGMVIALAADGRQRWKMETSSEVLSAPAVGQGIVLVRSLDNKITAFDAETGARRWTVQRPSPPLTLRSAPGMVISGQTAYVALPGGRLLAVVLANGGVRWEAAVGDPRGATELERIADISGAPVLAGRDICAVAFQGRIACFDAASGAVRWFKDFSSDAGVGADERFVFASNERNHMNAFARETGASVWRNDKLANRRLSTPISYGRSVAVGDFQGIVHFLSREDGSFIGRASIDGSPVVGTPLVAGSYLVFQTKSGTVAALAAD
jgi:outer membrane protein assembly factor BamB